MVELSCIAALTVVVAIGSMGWLGNNTAEVFTEACLAIDSTAAGSQNRIAPTIPCGAESIYEGQLGGGMSGPPPP